MTGKRKLNDEEQQHARDLQSEIDRLDSVVRSLPGDRFTTPAMAAAQDERNERQRQLDEFVGNQYSVDAAAMEQRDTAIANERDQLVIAQNAPFSESAPIAQGGESAIPEGVVESLPTDPHVISKTAGNVVVHQEAVAPASK